MKLVQLAPPRDLGYDLFDDEGEFVGTVFPTDSGWKGCDHLGNSQARFFETKESVAKWMIEGQQ